MANPFPQTYNQTTVQLPATQHSIVTVLDQAISIRQLRDLLQTTMDGIPVDSQCAFGVDSTTGKPSITITWTTTP